MCFTAMNLLFLPNYSSKISKAGYYVITCSLILPILWLLSTVLSSRSKKRRILTMNRKLLEMTNDNNNHSENNINFEFRSKIRRNNTKTCRKYITARKRGKLTKIGNKTRVKYTFHSAYNVVNTVSSKFSSQPHSYAFDSDSQIIGVDNHASRCMPNKRSDFITEIKPAKNNKVRGAGGNLQIKGIGTLRWRIQDDEGKHHEIYIKNALYITDLPISLLSPRHWSQQANDNASQKNGTWCATYDTHCVIHWDQQRYTKTVQHDQRTNTPRMYTLLRSTRYRKQVTALELLANTATLIKTVVFGTTQEEEEEEEEIDDIIDEDDNTTIEQLMDYSPHDSLPTPRELEIDDDSQASSLQGEFLR